MEKEREFSDVAGWVLVVLAACLTFGFAWSYVAAFMSPHEQLATKVQALVTEKTTVSESLCIGHLQLALSTNRDLLGLRFLATIVGSLLSVLGCLFVLTGIREAFRLTGSAATTPGISRATLATSSPGLVLITIGAAIIVTALLRTQSMDFKWPSGCLNPSIASSVEPEAPATDSFFKLKASEANQ